MSEFLFSDDITPAKTEQPPEEYWDVLIVDDEEAVHSITKTVLKSKVIDGKKLRFHSVYTGREATELLSQQSDFAVILLDVVMESDQAGLDACKFIRDELQLETVRIILRTGQPGSTPEEEVILKYRINDYKEKNELTASKLFSSVVSAVRSYNDLVTLEASKKALQQEKQAVEKASREIAEKARLLEQSNRYKTEFLANMSHELRTPLNSILILSGLLGENDRENLHQEQLESLGVIHKSGNELLDLIEDILALSQLETGKIKPYFQQHEVRELLRVISEKFKPLAHEKSLEFKCVIDSNVPSFAVMDFQKVKQALVNLLSNAIKFTKEGYIGVDVKYQAEPQQLNIEVRDTGIGIEQAQFATVFESFQQIDGSTSREFGGVGLGLTIAQRMLALVDGKISVISELGQGSCFTITVPLTHDISMEVSDIRPQFSEQETPKIEEEKKLVLIVDDNSRNVFSLIQGLKSRNVKIVVAENGQAALDKLAENPNIDIILMDIMMPIMDGNVAMKAIRASGEHNELPIIAITAKAMREDRAQALSSGASECVTKPVDMHKLSQLMDEWLH